MLTPPLCAGSSGECGYPPVLWQYYMIPLRLWFVSEYPNHGVALVLKCHQKTHRASYQLSPFQKCV